jgi:hypothetical protein
MAPARQRYTRELLADGRVTTSVTRSFFHCPPTGRAYGSGGGRLALLGGAGVAPIVIAGVAIANRYGSGLDTSEARRLFQPVRLLSGPVLTISMPGRAWTVWPVLRVWRSTRVCGERGGRPGPGARSRVGRAGVRGDVAGAGVRGDVAGARGDVVGAGARGVAGARGDVACAGARGVAGAGATGNRSGETRPASASTRSARSSSWPRPARPSGRTVITHSGHAMSRSPQRSQSTSMTSSIRTALLPMPFAMPRTLGGGTDIPACRAESVGT